MTINIYKNFNHKAEKKPGELELPNYAEDKQI